MTISLKLRKESPFKRLDGIGAHKGEVTIMKTGEGYGMPWVTAILKIDPEGFNTLAQAMMDANANEAVKAFGTVLAKGIEGPNSN